MAQPALPDDILHVLCEELANQDQFDTLFNCACSSRVLAVPALTHLYRYVTVWNNGNFELRITDMSDSSHHSAPVRGGGDDLYGPTKLLTIQRWSILWKSIIASALNATLFPYCRYIRNLDFRDLGYLLDEEQFRNKISKYATHARKSWMYSDFALQTLLLWPAEAVRKDRNIHLDQREEAYEAQECGHNRW
jgi:hypothetical protein